MLDYCNIVQKGTHYTDNYRGVTVASNLTKIISSVVNSRLLEWSPANIVLSDKEYGFKPGFCSLDVILIFFINY